MCDECKETARFLVILNSVADNVEPRLKWFCFDHMQQALFYAFDPNNWVVIFLSPTGRFWFEG